jgi:hypothetical protein
VGLQHRLDAHVASFGGGWRATATACSRAAVTAAVRAAM